jgi:hypothetical protein
MKENELRIGNYVIAPLWRNDGMHIQKVYSLRELWGEYYINYDFKESGCEFGAKIDTEVEPIPLTEEWLLKFGFEITNNFQTKDRFQTYKKNDIIWFEYGYIVIELKYVHQLQNLYFTLTGEELKLIK